MGRGAFGRRWTSCKLVSRVVTDVGPGWWGFPVSSCEARPAEKDGLGIV